MKRTQVKPKLAESQHFMARPLFSSHVFQQHLVPSVPSPVQMYEVHVVDTMETGVLNLWMWILTWKLLTYPCCVFWYFQFTIKLKSRMPIANHKDERLPQRQHAPCPQGCFRQGLSHLSVHEGTSMRLKTYQVKLRALPPSCPLQSRTRWCDQKRPYLAWPNKKARIRRTFPITITHLHCMQCWKEILTWSTGTILADCWVHQLRTTLIGAKPQSWRKGQESVVDLVVGIEKR